MTSNSKPFCHNVDQKIGKQLQDWKCHEDQISFDIKHFVGALAIQHGEIPSKANRCALWSILKERAKEAQSSHSKELQRKGRDLQDFARLWECYMCQEAIGHRDYVMVYGTLCRLLDVVDVHCDHLDTAVEYAILMLVGLLFLWTVITVVSGVLERC